MDLIYKEKTEVIIGILFEVYNCLGSGLKEKIYEQAIFEEVKRRNLKIKQQRVYPVLYKERELGVRRIDLLFDDNILIELKIGKRLSLKDFQQVNEYLKILKLELGLLALFSQNEVIVRRVVNLH